MRDWQLRYDNNAGGLACPACGETVTHVDRVHISARYEDAEPDEIRVSAISGRVETRCAAAAPQGKRVGEGRRHRIALIGWCECCAEDWALVFTQHKGSTYVEAVPAENQDHWEE